jgi:hypothetical protein
MNFLWLKTFEAGLEELTFSHNGFKYFKKG